MTQSDVLEVIVASLSPLVGGRVYTRTIGQASALPTWPSIRLAVVSATPHSDAAGDGGDAGADFRLQLDVVVAATAGESALQSLRESTMSAIAALGPEYIWEGEFNEFDAQTKTFRCALDYMVYLSSDAPGSPP